MIFVDISDFLFLDKNSVATKLYTVGNKLLEKYNKTKDKNQ